MVSRRALSACRLHRHQSGRPAGARRCLLQSARHGRAMDQESKGTIKWTRLSFRTLAANAPRLQLDALAYNPGNVMRTSALLKTAEPRSLIDLREKLIKIGAKV